MTLWLAMNYKSLHTVVSNWQVANTWRLFLHAFCLFEYNFLKLFIRKQDLYNTVFLSPFNLSDPCWIIPVEVNRALEAWSDCGPKYPLNVTTQVLERGSEAQKSCDRRSTASPATRNTEEVTPVVHVLAVRKAVATAHSLPDMRCFSRIEARDRVCYSLNRFGLLFGKGTSAHSSLFSCIIRFFVVFLFFIFLSFSLILKVKEQKLSRCPHVHKDVGSQMVL